MKWLKGVLLALLFFVPERLFLTLFENQATGRQTLHLLRWTLPYLVFICVAGQMQAVANLAGRDRTRTDILHEYFLPADGLERFLAVCRTVMPASRQDLLNITLRYVQEDRTSALAYARGDRVAAVLLFSQRMTQADEEDMMAMTQRLIDAALDVGGSFYLPYRLHARRDQVARAYPRLEEVVARKRHYDPGLLFRNTMWHRYLAP